MVVNLQDPYGGNDTDEKQEDRRRDPATQPKKQKLFNQVNLKTPWGVRDKYN